MSRTAAALVVAAFLSLSIAGCSAVGSTASPSVAVVAKQSPSESPSASPAGAAADSITIKGFEFEPARLRVRVGATVTWTNEEDSLHTVTSGTPDERTGLFDSGEFDTGETFSFTFPDAGTYSFFCDRHEFMRGEVVVAP